LLSFPRATDSQESLAAGAGLGGVADLELSASRLVRSFVDCPHSTAGCYPPCPLSPDAPVRRVAEADSGHALAGISAGLCLRSVVVSGNLLLGVRHDASIRRLERGGRAFGASSVRVVPRSLSRGFWPAREPARTKGLFQPRGSGLRALPVGCGRISAHSRQRLSLGSAGDHADRQRPVNPD